MPGITLSESLEEVDENLAELKQKAQKLPDSLKSAFLKKEAVSSCQVELNSRTLGEVVKDSCGFAHLKKPSERAEVAEVLQYIESMQLGRRLTEKAPLSVETIETLHKAGNIDKQGQAEVILGKIRTSQIAVGPASPPYTNTFFPAPSKHIRRLLDDLIHFVNNTSDMHPILKMGIAHVQFEAIHPFMQGNRQLGRVLLMLQLMNTGLIEKFTLYPSYAFKVVRWLYFNCLHDTRISGSWETWLHFFVGSISHSARDGIELCDDLLALQQRQRDLLAGNQGEDIDTAKVAKLLDISYRMPYLEKQTVALLFDEDYSVVRELLELFTRKGALEVVRDEFGQIWYHNKALCDEINKERHIASYASMLAGWMRVPSREKMQMTETAHSNYTSSSMLHEKVSSTTIHIDVRV